MNLFGSNMLPMISKNAGGSLLLDAIAANTAYSVRKLRTAYGGSCVRLRRSSDNAESDFGFSGNDLDVASIASWLGANTGFLVTWYDQSGNGFNAIQATQGSQPQYIASGFGGKPSFRFDGVSDKLSAGASPAQADAFTICAVVATHKTASYPMIACYGDSSVQGWNFGWDTAAGYKLTLNLMTATGAWASDHYPQFAAVATADQGYRVVAWRNAGNSAVRQNGSEATDTGTTTAMVYGAAPEFVIGNQKAVNTPEDRDIAELLYFSAQCTNGELSNIDASQSVYFGV